ncbi:hypothetical protein [Paraburkholderia terricola]|uniref:Uncharacterized protein n=1 Tax=Paraburkholderia terricola TaxID=169427 RepID=A0ABU1LQJ9_9BURK|nr:hypothetical protein [Paraburkholderia terricola]MDR6408795.1 hypothetical protein [Paraburkholderia terricola]MDR6482304.1 hypothetical protein [Paraburkholderia terricola]
MNGAHGPDLRAGRRILPCAVEREPQGIGGAGVARPVLAVPLCESRSYFGYAFVDFSRLAIEKSSRVFASTTKARI